jgi:hypothetical protein
MSGSAVQLPGMALPLTAGAGRSDPRAPRKSAGGRRSHGATGSAIVAALCSWAALSGLSLPVRAERLASADLAFRVQLTPDSITVGDPISLVLEASAPGGATLGLPQLADSVGPFAVLSARAPATALKDQKLTVRQEAQVTLFKTGTFTFPELELLWERAPGETLVARSRPVEVKVRSLLKGQAGMQNLHGLKGVVALERVRWWLWGSIALAAAALALVLWKNRARFRRRAAWIPAVPAAPPLPPDVAFERGISALYKKELPERGLVKEFYAELSLLFRRYLEDRFLFPAVEETRTEVMAAAGRVAQLDAADQRALSDWLQEGDLVKFAKLDRLVAEANVYGERARDWVRRTAPRPAPPEGGAS